MNERDIIRWLWQYGYFRAPQATDSRNVTADDIDKLTLADLEVQEAVEEFQSFYRPTLEPLVQKHHNRSLIVDGYIGPASIEAMELPRCGHPDYDTGDRQWNREDANWPTSCRKDLLFSRDFEKLPNLSREDTDRVWLAVCNNWMSACPDIGLRYEFNKPQSRIWAGLKSLPGSTLAWSYLATSNCSDRLIQAYDSTTSWSLVLAVTTATHEVGHALGHNHVNDGEALMYPSINTAARARWGYPNATDLRQAVNLGYQVTSNPKPLEPTDQSLFRPTGSDPIPPPPPLPPPPSPWPVHGILTIDGKLYRIEGRLIS